MAGGITYDGQYISSEEGDPNFAKKIDIDENDPNVLKLILDKKPILLQEKIEQLQNDYQNDLKKNNSFMDDLAEGVKYYDNLITGSYTTDLAFGALYPLCISGVFGTKVRQNSLDIGKLIISTLRTALTNIPRVLSITKVIISLMLDNSIGAQNLKKCVYGNVNTDKLLEQAGFQTTRIVGKGSQRMFYSFTVEILIARYVPTVKGKQIASIYAFWAVLWGAAMRLIIDLRRRFGKAADDSISIFTIFESWITGSSDANLSGLHIDTDTDIIRRMDKCTADVDPREIETLKYVIESVIKFGENPT